MINIKYISLITLVIQNTAQVYHFNIIKGNCYEIFKNFTWR